MTESRATWSPDGSHVAYVKYNSTANTYDLYAARVDGAGEARIASVPGSATNFDWSPDGSRFVFEKDHQYVFVMDADGSNQRQLTFTEQTLDGPTHDEDPLWSFDGARVTFTRRNNAGANVYIINADGAGLRRLLNEYTVRAQLSPDGTKLVSDGVYVKNVDESVYPYWLGEGHDPSWQSLPNPNPTPTPTPVETFSISGRVTESTPSGFPFHVSVRLTGTRAVTVTSDAAGNYTFINLPKGGTYTVTPQRPGGDIASVYTPGSRTVSDLQSDLTGFDFTKATVPRVIRGRVMDAAGNGLAGVRVTDTPGNQFFGATTDAQGRYSVNFFFMSDFLTLQPFSNTLTFDPFRAVLRRPTDDVVLNFVGAPNANVRFHQGRIIDTSGFPLAGLPVTVSGGRSAVVKTDEDGRFTFFNLPVGPSYTFTPSPVDGLAFTPAQRTYDNLNQTTLDTFVANVALPTVQFAATTRAQALRAVAENAQFTRRETNRAFVLMQYFGYLRRGPSESPDSDFVGWQFWLNKLNEFNGNYIAAEMVKAFITSDEYRRRFGRQ